WSMNDMETARIIATRMSGDVVVRLAWTAMVHPSAAVVTDNADSRQDPSTQPPRRHPSRVRCGEPRPPQEHPVRGATRGALTRVARSSNGGRSRTVRDVVRG